MYNFRTLTIWTIALSSLIIIGAGHGIACVGLLEIAGLFYKFGIGTENFSLSPMASYDNSLGAVAIFSLVGHISLVISIVTKKYSTMFRAKIVGLIFLWISFYYLTHSVFYDSLALLSLVTGIPFLVNSLILIRNIARQKSESNTS